MKSSGAYMYKSVIFKDAKTSIVRVWQVQALMKEEIETTTIAKKKSVPPFPGQTSGVDFGNSQKISFPEWRLQRIFDGP